MKSDYSILANFYINDKETLFRMKDSLNSFKACKSELWIINIRGKYKHDAAKFIKASLCTNYKISFNDYRDWQKETKILIECISTKYILIWVEDHILMKEPSYIDKIVFEMNVNESDYLNYTFFCFGYHKIFYDSLNFKSLVRSKNINTFQLNLNSYSKIYGMRDKFKFSNLYITALPSIFSKKLFLKLLYRRHFNFKLIQTPHFIEKPPFSIRYLPFNMSYLNEELFASIDDDRGIEKYSLINRKLYPNREGVKFDYSMYTTPKGFIDGILFPNKLKYLIYTIKNFLY